METSLYLISVLGSMISYFLVDYIFKFSRRYIPKPKQGSTYSEKLSELTSNLIKSSKEVDQVLTEISAVAGNREDTIKKLELNLLSLEMKEKDLKQKIETLEKLPLPVAEQFIKLLESGEKRSEKRDYLLFGAGVLVSTVIAIILKSAGLA